MSYCTRSDIEDLFGPLNVAKWADLDNDQDAAAIAARIARAIAVSSAKIDDRLRGGPYSLPINGSPATLVNLCASLAGVWLYESRGVQDYSPDGGFPVHRLRWFSEQAEKTLRDLRAGVLRLDVALTGYGTTAPMVVKERRA